MNHKFRSNLLLLTELDVSFKRNTETGPLNFLFLEFGFFRLNAEKESREHHISTFLKISKHQFSYSKKMSE